MTKEEPNMNANTAHNDNDNRRETRSSVNLQGQTDSFYVEFVDQTIPIINIRDVSITGVGLEIDQIIDKGETVELGYNSDDMELKVKGTVIWCDTSTTSVMLGVEFSKETLQENILFFMAMRKFLDEFDGIAAIDV